MSQNNIIVSGVQPTGNLHIGNYLGALKNWISLQNQNYQCFFSVVDLHAITIPYSKEDFASICFNTAITLLSCGVDPEKSCLFIQSHIPEHTALMWLISSITPYGDLTRMTQFKDKSLQHSQNINVGLFTYPVLMAADILIYKASYIPVGEDQLQHLELAREIVYRFNDNFQTDFFMPPQPMLSKTLKLKGLDGKSKMSKSLNNYIALSDDPKIIEGKIKKAMTDPARIRKTDAGNPEICNIYTMHKEFSTEQQVETIKQDCSMGKIPCIECKKCLIQNLNSFLEPIHEKYHFYQENPSLVKEILADGALKAQKEAKKNYEDILDIMGFYKTS